jgi:LysM repeat protein
MRTNKRSATRVAGVAVGAGLMVGLVNPSLWAGPAAPAGPRPTHVVAPGETLWGLAERHAGRQDPRNYIYDLQKLNDLGPRPIYPGEHLLLP